MGGKSGGSQPAPPDPAATAAAQSGLNAETARLQALLNRANQVTPYGSLTWSRPSATTGALATGAPPSTGQTLQPAPNPAPTTQGIWRDEGGGMYRDMNTGALQRMASPPGSPGSEPGVYYGSTPAANPTATTTSGGATKLADGTTGYDPNDVWQSTITLSPEGQRQFDLQNQLSNSIGSLALRNFGNVEAAQANPFSLSGLGDAPVANDATRRRVEEALFNQAQSRLDPIRQKQEEALRTRLAAQGIPINSEAYGREFDTFNRGQNDLYSQALANAILAGGQEQSRLFGMESAGRQNAIQEMLLQRNQPINELAALLGTSPGVQTPQFTPAGATGVAPTDITGPTMAAYQGQLNAANQRQAQNAATTGGLFGLGGSLGSAYLLSNPATAPIGLGSSMFRAGKG